MLPPLSNSRPRLRSLLPCLPACPTLQVERQQELLGELDAIPPRLQRSLEDYKRHEATLDLITAVLADIVSANLQPCVALPAMHAVHAFSCSHPLGSVPDPTLGLFPTLELAPLWTCNPCLPAPDGPLA